MTTEDQLLEIARRHRVGVYFDGKSRRDGLPSIRLLKNGTCLAEFFDTEDALNWFPKNHLPGAAGKTIHSTAN